MSRAGRCCVCNMYNACQERQGARGRVRIDETNPIPSVSQYPPRSAGQGLWGLPAVGRGCEGGKKYRHGEQRRRNGLQWQLGGLRVWRWEKLSDGKESEDEKEFAWGGCKTPSPPSQVIKYGQTPEAPLHIPATAPQATKPSSILHSKPSTLGPSPTAPDVSAQGDSYCHQ